MPFFSSQSPSKIIRDIPFVTGIAGQCLFSSFRFVQQDNMGRRNYDLTGITPGSPAWKVQQERKYRRAGLSGPAPALEPPSTPTGDQSDLPIDEDKTPRALPTVPEERDEKTPTVANFPAEIFTQIDNSAARGIASTQLTSGANTRTSEARPSFKLQPSRGPPTVVDFASQPHPARMLQEVALPKTPEELWCPEEYNLAPTLRNEMGIQSPITKETPPWQPMTMEDFDIGNRVLQALASQGRQSHVVDSCVDSSVFLEDIVMGED